MAFLNNADEPQMDLPDAEQDARYQQNLARAHELLEHLPRQWPIPEETKQQSPATDGNEDALRADLIEQRFTSWLTTQRQQVAHWTSLRPIELSSSLPILTLETDDTVFVSGKPVLDQGKVVGIDEKEVYEKVDALSLKLLERARTSPKLRWPLV